jgi:hypothetical protein
MSDIFSASLLIHVFNGERRTTPSGRTVVSGFHYEGEGMQAVYGTKVLEETRGEPDFRGVYTARVLIRGRIKKQPSIFFPKSWTRAQILESCRQAYTRRKPMRAVGAVCQWWRGRTRDGMVIMFFIENDTVRAITPIREALKEKTPAQRARKKRARERHRMNQMLRGFSCLNVNDALLNQVSFMAGLAQSGGIGASFI